MAVPPEMLLHPEFLSNEQILCIVKERHLRVQNIENMNRDQLLEVFHNFCVPHGQRRYRDIGRGKILNKNRISNMEVDSQRIDAPQKLSQKSLHCDRIKPPPDLLSGHIKRIKISVDVNTNAALSKDNSNKRKNEFSKVSNDEPTPQKKTKKLISWP